MAIHASATSKFGTWDEKPFHEIEGGPKLTRASITNAYHGDIEGEGILEYVLVTRADGTADFVGLERVIARLGDRSGSFVLQHSGTYDNGAVKGAWFVVTGSGTGDLQNLRGDGGYTALHGQDFASVTLDYDVA
jgi:Protein of unknown function (DUF3224)